MMFKVHPVRHILIIVVIAVVLFPILWIFTTSIRRDNSSISPDLFSDQTTWQNYVDLILERKNVPALYNEISNIYSLGSPYNKMSKGEILNTLNGNFSAFEGYFKGTSKMNDSITSDASWISVNFIPKAESEAIENVKSNAGMDMTYLSTFSAYLSNKFNALDQNYKLAGLYDTLNTVKASQTQRAIEIAGQYFPDILTTRATYTNAMATVLPSISNVPGEVSQMLLENNADGKTAKDLVGAYQETVDSLKNGTFNYGQWFAPVYLRRINMDTINLSNTLPSTVSQRLQNIKTLVFASIQKVNSAQAVYDKSVNDAISKVQSVRNDLTGTLQSSLTNLNNTYSTLQTQLSTMMASSTALLSAMSYDASQVSIFSNNIVPTAMAIDDMISVMKGVLNGKTAPSTQSGVFYDVSSYISQIKNWVGISSKYHVFDSITAQVQKILDDLEYIQNNQSLIFTNMSSNAISNVKSSLPIALLKLQSGLSMSLSVLQNYDASTQKYDKIASEVPQMNKTISEISSEIPPMQQKINDINSKIALSSLYFKTILMVPVIKTDEAKIGDFESATAFLSDLNAYYGTLVNSSIYKDIQPIPPSSRYDQFFNTQKLIDTINLTLQTTSQFNTFNAQYGNYISNLKERSNAYIDINLLGFPFSVNELNAMNNLYQNQYVSTIAPALGIVSRRTNELAALPYFKDISGRLNSINNTSYYLTQDWQVKYLPPFLLWLLNSIIVAGSAAVITVLLSALMAYPFSRLRFSGRKYGLISILLIQMFPTMMAMVALYLLLNYIGQFLPFLGLNSLGGLAFLYIGGGIAFNSWLIKGFFDTIPTELEEAAMVDGATRFQTFWRIILPLSAPILAVTVILSFIGNYGDYILASIIMSGINHYTFAVGLQTFATSQYSSNWGLITTAALIGMIPILALFISLQRFIVGGLTQGSVKG
ncbi:MAG: sugar ABC transporter permease [Thermotogae bacterium]|jgi:maltose/maltodextrin transport system permease protein|nr:sugar ABC transporter permease [Thermotogota bacterium]MCL5032043.1 sugar ABC transporter permease [Thermotogota bacterium]